MDSIVLIGAGGHCKVVAEALHTNNAYKIAGIFDNENKTHGPCNILIIGKDDDAKSFYSNNIQRAFLTIVGLGINDIRKQLFKYYSDIGYSFPIIQHSKAIVSKTTKIGEGTFIAAGSIIGPDVIIGKNAIINSGAIIDHDCNVGDYSHIAPGSILCGDVLIGNSTHIGSGSNIIQGISIGSNTIIGAGSVVVKNIPENVLAYGNPCRIIKYL
ncbi:MAG: acetyltransferase [Desulfobacterales bacterium]|nr:acetyltransferase [Desulfobacterales bacterium]